MSANSSPKRQKLSPATVDNLIDGKTVPPSTKKYIPVTSPQTGEVIANVAVSSRADVDTAVHAGEIGFAEWSKLTVKARAAVMLKFHHLIDEHSDELADLVVSENGKNKAEALASVAKANETVEWACSLPQLIQGKILQVSRGITCFDTREPLGVVACVVPFNFPIMVPMWTVPIALVAGNAVILKPSEKVPMTMNKVAQLLYKAGVPKNVFQIVNGTSEVVNALCDHPQVQALTFVGSSKVAEIVAKRCRALNKRVLALGGAKNHLIALPDADPELAAQDIVASFAGCAGQRCMAASALVLVGDCSKLLKRVVELSKALTAGVGKGQVGPVIDSTSQKRILDYINDSEAQNAEILVDGRGWATSHKQGCWVGPTIILHHNRDDKALHEEIFGPVLSVIKVKTPLEAIEIENANPYGNAAAIYTSSGGSAEYFTSKFRAAMIGVNIGIPVPREPFSFGGLYGTRSKFGDMDITGDGCMEFFTNRKKVTTKWAKFDESAAFDAANFAGSM